MWPDTFFPPPLRASSLWALSMASYYVMPFRSAAAAVTAVVPGLSGYMGCMVYQNI